MSELLPNQIAQYRAPASAAPATRDATGAPVPSLSAPVPLWVRELTGYTAMAEGPSGGATRAQFTTRLLTRYRADLRPEGIVELDGPPARCLEITGITPAPRSPFRRWLHLHCVQKRA